MRQYTYLGGVPLGRGVDGFEACIVQPYSVIYYHDSCVYINWAAGVREGPKRMRLRQCGPLPSVSSCVNVNVNVNNCVLSLC